MKDPHEVLVRELKAADTGALSIAAAMCLYRVMPVLEWRASPGGPDVSVAADRWHPGVVERELFGLLGVLRANIDPDRSEGLSEEIEEIFSMASEMVLRAFVEDFEVSRWADWCSSLCLDIHQAFDGLAEEGEISVGFYPAGTYPDLTELQACELEDQVRILHLLHGRSPVNDVRVLEISDAGRARVSEALRQVVDREH